MDTRALRPLSLASYGVAAILIFFPLVDSAQGLWPFQAGEAVWRFGALGLLSRAIMTPMLGLLLALATATLFGDRRTLRLLAVVALGAAGLAAAGAGLFIFDAVEMRSQVRGDARTAFNSASVLAILKYGAGAFLGTLMGVGGWMASRVAGAKGSVAAPAPAEKPGRTGEIVAGSPRR
jgi:hypothetical protein